MHMAARQVTSSANGCSTFDAIFSGVTPGISSVWTSEAESCTKCMLTWEAKWKRPNDAFKCGRGWNGPVACDSIARLQNLSPSIHLSL